MTNYQNQVCESYEKIATWYDKNRSRDLFEKPYLDMAISYLNPTAKILDVGCGMGEPIAQYFIEQEFDITGIDGSKKLIEMAQSRYPENRFLLGDMRQLHLGEKFDLVIAWNSFFHLSQDDQKKMFNIFKNHLNTAGVLLFTSGPNAGEIWSDNGGENLYHASLSPDEYKALLNEHGFELIMHKIEDKDCNNHSVWFSLSH